MHVARPAGPLRGGVVLIHEIWGLVPHIRGIADRLAGEGWLVAARDLLSRAGVQPEVGPQLQDLLFSADEEVRAAAQPRIRDAMASFHSADYQAWALGVLGAVVDRVAAEPAVGAGWR